MTSFGSDTHYSHYRFYFRDPQPFPNPGFGQNLDELENQEGTDEDDDDEINPPGFGDDPDQEPSLIDQAKDKAKDHLHDQIHDKVVDPLTRKVKDKFTGTTTEAGENAAEGAAEATSEGAAIAGESTAVASEGAAIATEGAAVAAEGAAAAAETAAVAVGAVAEAASGVGILLLIGQLLASKKVRTILLWTLIILVMLAFLIVIVWIQIFNIDRGPGPKLNGGSQVTPIQNKSLPAQAAGDKGQFVTTSLSTIDQSIAGIQAVLKKNPSIPNASQITSLFKKLKELKQATESKSYADSQTEATQLQQYQQILHDLNLAIDPNAAAQQTVVLSRITNNDGITILPLGGCAPLTDIQNLAVTSKLLSAIVSVADIAKANNLTANLTCLVTGYREVNNGSNDYPMCGTIDGQTGVLTERQADIAAHCNGRAADFGGDYTALYNLVKTQASSLGFTAVDANDHMHIEVTP